MRALVATMIVLLALAPHVRADPRTDAQAALERGVAAYRANDLVTARAELTTAHDLSPDSANPYRWLAIVERDLGDCRTALVHVEGFLARVPAGDPRIAEVVALRNACVLALRAEAPPPAAPPPATDPPTRWWLVGIGAGAAAVLATILLVVVTSGDDPARLPPITCGVDGCR